MKSDFESVKVVPWYSLEHGIALRESRVNSISIERVDSCSILVLTWIDENEPAW